MKGIGGRMQSCLQVLAKKCKKWVDERREPRLPLVWGSVKKSGPVHIGGVALVPSRKWLPWLACAAIAAAGFPGLAQGDAESSDPPATGAIVAEDNFFHEVGSAASDNTVEI